MKKIPYELENVHLLRVVLYYNQCKLSITLGNSSLFIINVQNITHFVPYAQTFAKSTQLPKLVPLFLFIHATRDLSFLLFYAPDPNDVLFMPSTLPSLIRH